MTDVEARRLLLVVGKGRSGTSLFSGIMGRLGFHVPQPEVKADETNPKGFGEPRWVVRFHKRLMRDRRVLTIDEEDIVTRAEEIGRRVWRQLVDRYPNVPFPITLPPPLAGR